MKPHLPIIVLIALLGTFVAKAVNIPDDYEHVDLMTSADLDAYTSNTTDDKYAFILWSDINFTPTTNASWTVSTPLVTGGALIYTTTEGYAPVALSFNGNKSFVFLLPSNLSFDTLSNLTISNQSEVSMGCNAINLGSVGKLYIKNVNDGAEDTPDVFFSGNRTNSKNLVKGSVIFSSGSSSLVDVLDNGDLYITGNSANSVSYQGNSSLASGGAFCLEGSCNISYNGDIHINDNASSSAATDYYSKYTDSESHGGAIYSNGILNISNNEDVDISGNSALSTSFREPNSYNAYNSFYSNSTGGAIYSAESISISDNNGNVSIVGNSAFSNAAYKYGESRSVSRGGAIGATGSIDISNNKDVLISGNSANSAAKLPGTTTTGSPYPYVNYSYGGAIYSTDSLCINNNEDVLISGNSVISFGSTSTIYSSYGGAIYSTGSISLFGNDSVTFENNYEKVTNYQLRSIYMSPDSASDVLVLAAKTQGHITFYDSVYMGNYSGSEVSLNADYIDADGIAQKATGDVVFSGKFTEEHLKEIKGGTAGTASEIANSRTSELLNTVNLYGGTLRVEDKAVLKTHAINVVAGSNATMKVSDATVDATGYDIKVNDSAVLVIGGTNGSSTLIAKNINIGEGATLSLTRTQVTTENVAMTLAAVDSMSVYNDQIAGVVRGNLSLAGGATLIADGAHLSMDGGILDFLATTENKTNLVLTLGAEYGSDSQIILFSDVDTAKFLQDNITATSNSSIVTLKASDYFAGEWVNDKTELVYDDGTIYVTGVNIVVPEPTTATLSLLALVGLAARRRRK